MTVEGETKFVLLMTGRSGSVWVMSTINSLPHVMGYGALFLRRERASGERWDSDYSRPRFIETEPDGLALRPFSVFAYLDDVYATPGTIGFKLNYAQLGHYPEILAYFIRHRVRIVHLVRRNHLDVVLSYAVKAKLGQAHLLAGQAAPDELRVDLDDENLVGQLERLQRNQNIARKLLSWSRLPHLEVAYEDLLRDQANFFPVFDFLSVKHNKEIPDSTVVKIRKTGHRDVISNYDEVQEVLADSKFASLLE